MRTFTDIHSHILPGLDDGAQTFEESVEIAAVASKNGINKIIATPHFGGRFPVYEKEYIENKTSELNSELSNRNIDVTIYPGAEMFCTPEIIEWVSDGRLVTLANGNHILIDLPFNEIPIFLPDLIFKLKLSGLTPILAHIERNSLVQSNLRIADSFIDQGALIQVNSTSISGFLGKAARNASFNLIKKRKAHIVASDAHAANGRAPNFEEAFKIIEKIADRQYANTVMNTNPLDILP